MIAADTPFVLLDDARAQGAAPARLYTAPRDVAMAHNEEDYYLPYSSGCGARRAMAIMLQAIWDMKQDMRSRMSA